MGRYVARRLMLMIPILIGTTFLIYLMVWALPGDPFAGKCGERPCGPEYIESMNDKYHFDKPLWVQYGYYVWNLLHLNFGETFSGASVSQEIAQAFPLTLRLACLAIAFQIIIGISAGVLSALRKGRFADQLVLVSTLVVISIPIFVIGFMLQYIFGIQLGWASPTVSPQAPWRELILPAFVLASLSLAYVARLMRSSLNESLQSDYIRTATAKGLSRRRVVGKHAMRNSLIPVVTFLGADFGALLGGAVVTEGIFNIAGIGGLTYLSIKAHEGAMVVAVVTLLVFIFLAVNLVVDLLYGVIDPRVRHE